MKTKSRHNIFPPLFDAYAASILEKSGFNVNILDSQAEDMTYMHVLQEVKTKNPDIIISRISLPSFESDVNNISKIKHDFPKIICVGWGSICKVNPEKVLSKSKLDTVITDELESTILDLIQSLEKGKGINQVHGISFKIPEKITHNPSRPCEKNLDLLPIPAYHLLKMEKYVARESYFSADGSRHKFVPFFTLLSSRGCNFNCVYCPYPVIFGRWRGMSPERTVDEMELLVKKYHIEAFWFHDQVFTMTAERVENICNEIINRGLDIKWACQTHARKLTSNLIKRMRKAGCSRIEIGVETGDPKLLATIGKPGSTITDIKEAIKSIHEEEILVEANFIIGLPGESWEAIRNTANLIKQANPDNMAISFLTPYPGTKLFQIAEEKKWFITNDWGKYSTSQPVIAFPDFTEKDMIDAYEYLIAVFYFYHRLGELLEAVKKHKFKVLLRKLVNNMPEIAAGAYKLVKLNLKRKIKR